METYEQNLHISDSAFEGMRMDTDRVLQRLIKNMVEKDSLEGKVTITIDVALKPEFIPNRDPGIDGESRKVLIPSFSHKVGSVMQIKNEAKGGTNYEGMELVWDEELGEYVMKPIANTEQMSIFDADFRCVNDEDVEVDEEAEHPALEGRRVAALPGPETEESELDDTEAVEEEDEYDVAEAEDVSEEFGGMPMPFSEVDEDDYDYEEPEEF